MHKLVDQEGKGRAEYGKNRMQTAVKGRDA